MKYFFKKKLFKYLLTCFAIFFLFLLAFFFQILIIFKNLFLSSLKQNVPLFQKNFLFWQKISSPCKKLKNFNQNLALFFGFDKPKTYFILLQNNYELRATGGFMGSYAKLKFFQGVLTDFQINDIYAPDGQLKGHVEPPWPLEQAFQLGSWKLRDSNWEPDFPLAAKQINWFFEKSKEEKADALIALNFLVIKDVIKIFEPLFLPDYNLQIKADNFFFLAQQKAEKDFFPGSSQKKDFLASLSKKLLMEIEKADFNSLIKLIKELNKNLRQKQILLFFFQPSLNKIASQLNFTGEIKRKFFDNDKVITDYFFLVDTNLGANKADFYIQKNVLQKIKKEGNILKNTITISYTNKSWLKNPNFTDFWGGNHKNFLRLLLPLEAEIAQIKINGKNFEGKKEIKEYKNKKVKSLGFFVETPPLSQTLVEIEYQKPLSQKLMEKKLKYILEIQKQPGIDFYFHQLNFSPNKTKNIKIQKDRVIKLVF